METFKQLSAVTLQEQLYQELYKQIKSGKYKPGDRIPPELQLSEIYHISRVTVRHAIQQLVDEHILIKKHGKGTFVKTPIHTEEIFSGGSFTDTCLRMHAKPSTKIVECRLCKGDSELIKKLQTDSEMLIEITRVRLVDEVPCIVEVDYFPASFTFLMQENLEHKSLLKLVQQEANLIPSKFEDHFQISFADKQYAKLLNTPTSTPLLEVTQSVMCEDDTMIYINKQYILTTKYVYAVRSAK
ncbi:MAG: GntR family transcriptional regulator [Longicatena sp.]